MAEIKQACQSQRAYKLLISNMLFDYYIIIN